MRKLSLREMQLKLVGLMEEFDRICREHNLRYTIAYGTLIGAVRHKGFIPWDDDADVCMPRPDYERFIEIVRAGGVLSDRYELTEDRGSKTYYNFVKLLDTNYPLKTPNHIEAPYLYLDIFPIDGMPGTDEEAAALCKRQRRWITLAGMCQWYTMDRWWGVFAYIIGWWLYLGVNIFVGRKRAVRKLNEMALSYPYENSPRRGIHRMMKKEWVFECDVFDSYKTIEFEGKTFSVVENIDGFLRPSYGDYMQLPPPEQRRSRHYMSIYELNEREQEKNQRKLQKRRAKAKKYAEKQAKKHSK